MNGRYTVRVLAYFYVYDNALDVEVCRCDDPDIAKKICRLMNIHHLWVNTAREIANG